MLYCPSCSDWFLRSARYEHEHELLEEPDPDSDESDSVTLDTDIEVAPKTRMGAVYDVEISYNIDFRFQVVASTDHEASDIADMKIELPSNCADAFQVHSRTSEHRTIYADDDGLPDDWDPYGTTPLNEVYGKTDGD